MADLASVATAASAAVKAASPAIAGSIELFGFTFNPMGIAILIAVFGILWLFYTIHRDQKLDFADLITKDGRTASLTKVLQLVGGITATWVIMKLTLAGQLTEALFGLYLTYVGAIEGYSKYVAAKYNYSETSVKDAAKKEEQ